MKYKNSTHQLAQLETGFRIDSTRLEELEKELESTLHSARHFCKRHSPPELWSTTWDRQWDTAEQMVHRIRVRVGEMHRLVESAGSDDLKRASDAWEGIQSDNAQLLGALNAIKSQTSRLNAVARREWDLVARNFDSQLETIQAVSKALRIKLELLKTHSPEVVGHLVNDVLSKLPNRVRAAGVTTDEYEMEYGRAEKEIEQEHHRFLGFIDVVKGLFLWVESTEERVDKNLSQEVDQVAHQPIVVELIALLESRPDLVGALQESIRKAERSGISDLAEYYIFLDEMVTLIPVDRHLNDVIIAFYFLIDQSPNGVLKADTAFQAWTHRFAEEWGDFLDSTESARGIGSFLVDPDYHIQDFYAGPSGWLTFNQFFARRVRPGKRPIDGRCDDATVVSPADSVFQGKWAITDDSKITAKGLTWSLADLLHGSPYRDRFRNGLFTHSFLNVNDYHWFHVPVGGVVKEVRRILGKVVMDVAKAPDGSLAVVDGLGYQFSQARGLIILETSMGLVAVLPIGMAQVSSVTLTAEVGSVLCKGDEFGFFSFGGSDIVTLFEAGRVQIDAEVGTHYKQGRQIGRAVATNVLG